MYDKGTVWVVTKRTQRHITRSGVERHDWEEVAGAIKKQHFADEDTYAWFAPYSEE